MPILTARNLTKSFGSHTILDGADCSIHTGERVGLVGVNGSGKSTLARILAGIETSDSGTLAKRRGAAVAYLSQDPAFDGDETAEEAVTAGLAEWSIARTQHEQASSTLADGDGDLDTLLAAQSLALADVERLGGWDRMAEIAAMLTHVGIQRPQARVSTMSGGERRRVALARLLVSRPALAILDEPTNHLDVETIEWLEDYLIDQPGALLLITHDRYLLDRVATRTWELDQGKLFSYDGGYELYLEQKAERLSFVARTEQNRQNFLRTELEWLRRQPKARSTKQKARIERAESAKSAPPPPVDRSATFTIEGTRTGKTILELRDVELSAGGRVLAGGIELFLTQGERVGVVGRNGTGKTTLLRAVLGEVAPSSGKLTVGQNTKIAYFDQQRGSLDDSLSIYDNVAGDQPKIEINGQPIEPRAYLERFLFDPQKQRQKVASLSGGERARVALAKMLRQPSNLVLLDEPTNDLDVATLGALEEMLTEFGGTTLVVTHDRWFLDRVATAILAFEGDGTVVRYAGNYTSYREHRDARRALAAEAAKPIAAPKPRQATATTKKGLTNNERRELEGILAEIDAAEAAVSALETAMADPLIYGQGGDKVRGLVAELDAAKLEVSRKVARWEELESKAT